MIKTTLVFGLMALALGCASQSTSDTNEVNKTIQTFAKAADENDVTKLSLVLNDNFKIIMNRLFGSTEISLLDKEFYLAKIESKEWGGEKRTLTIENVNVVGNNASAKVTFTGEKSTLVSLIQLVKDDKGKWKLITDLPTFG